MTVGLQGQGDASVRVRWRDRHCHHMSADWLSLHPVGAARVRPDGTLRERDDLVVTLADLADLLPGRAPQSSARALPRGRVAVDSEDPLSRGVLASPPGALPGTGILRVARRMRVRPDTSACLSGRSVAMIHHWLPRPVGPAIGPPLGKGVPVSERLPHRRWSPKIPLDETRDLPMWNPTR